MKPYELALVLKPTATEEEIQATLEKFNSFITSRGGVVEKTNTWGKRRLASIIEKQFEGIYTFINFRIPPNDVGELTRIIRLTETVIRHIIIKEEGKAIRAVQQIAASTPPPSPETGQPEEGPAEEGPAEEGEQPEA